MERYQGILAYDGARYQGFQRQAEDMLAQEPRTIQGTVESALGKLGWGGTSILSAGRTDTGVHASGQVVAFDLEWNHSLDDLVAALNANLPADIAFQKISTAPSGFHPRYDASSRHYAYRVYPHKVRNPLIERYAWRVWPLPDLKIMQSAADELVGEQDFAAFGTPPGTGSNTVRRVFAARWYVSYALAGARVLVFQVAANAYLYHMVRRLVSVLIEIGQGRMQPEMLRSCFMSPPEEPLQGLAPACGLVLERVTYDSADASA